MTALVPSHTAADDAVIQPITFILCDHRLVTIRYTEPRAFTTFPQRAEKSGLDLSGGGSIPLSLLDSPAPPTWQPPSDYRVVSWAQGGGVGFFRGSRVSTGHC
jgi:hypothetical protein